MRRWIFSSILVIFFAILFAGCRSAEMDEAAREDREMRKCGETLIQAFLKGDEKNFFAQLPAGIASQYKLEENRAALFREFGEVESARFLTALETPPPLRTYVWVVRFRRPAVIGTRQIDQEVLCRVVVGKADGRFQVYSFAF